jgi:hypothetical protein
VCDLTRHPRVTGQNIGQAPWAIDSMDMCAIKVFYIIIITCLQTPTSVRFLRYRWTIR